MDLFITLDGVYQAPDGRDGGPFPRLHPRRLAGTVLSLDDESGALIGAGIDHLDALLLGRTTYDVVAGGFASVGDARKRGHSDGTAPLSSDVDSERPCAVLVRRNRQRAVGAPVTNPTQHREVPIVQRFGTKAHRDLPPTRTSSTVADERNVHPAAQCADRAPASAPPPHNGLCRLGQARHRHPSRTPFRSTPRTWKPPSREIGGSDQGLRVLASIIDETLPATAAK